MTQRARYDRLLGALRPERDEEELPPLPAYRVEGCRIKPTFWHAALPSGVVDRVIFGSFVGGKRCVFIENRSRHGGHSNVLLRPADLATVAAAIADARQAAAAGRRGRAKFELAPGKSAHVVIHTSGDATGPRLSFVRKRADGAEIGAPMNLDSPQLDALDRAMAWLAEER